MTVQGQAEISDSRELPADLAWRRLTRMPGKAKLYGNDLFFRQGYAEFASLAGPLYADLLDRIAILMIKPDGLMAGKATDAVRFVEENGFGLVGHSWLAFHPLTWRALWQYQLTSATIDRLLVNDIVLRGPSLLLLLCHADTNPPASVWLSNLKGPSDTDRQGPNCLRSRLQQPNRVLSFVHVADEPADILRELPILLPQAERERLWQCMVASEADDFSSLAAEIAQRLGEPHTVDTKVSLERVKNALSLVTGDREAKRAALQDLARMRSGERISWSRFSANLARTQAHCDPWDLMVLGSSFIVYDRTGFPKQIAPGTVDMWQARPKG